ncbi:hypothetical protein KBC03_07500 [Patescibacteria group bacterium]|nr:hypothetical protein [Patescibacteria group bacterium]
MTISPTYTYADQKSNREFLPGWVRDLPVYLYRLYFTVKAGHPFFFSNVNPGFFFSGFVELDKHSQLKDLDPHVLPKMLIAHADESIETIEKNLETHGITYPFIAKPNIVGRNGTNVKKIDSREELSAYRM